jgi:hypothetical protein
MEEGEDEGFYEIEHARDFPYELEHGDQTCRRSITGYRGPSDAVFAYGVHRVFLLPRAVAAELRCSSI